MTRRQPRAPAPAAPRAPHRPRAPRASPLREPRRGRAGKGGFRADPREPAAPRPRCGGRAPPPAALRQDVFPPLQEVRRDAAPSASAPAGKYCLALAEARGRLSLGRARSSAAFSGFRMWKCDQRRLASPVGRDGGGALRNAALPQASTSVLASPSSSLFSICNVSSGRCLSQMIADIKPFLSVFLDFLLSPSREFRDTMSRTSTWQFSWGMDWKCWRLKANA